MNTQPDFEELLKLLEQNKVNFIGKTDLIKNKKASGRPQDELDAKTLRKSRKDVTGF